ncbi:MAG: RHS repeat-associated core domain-containing protein [Verrucomicrobia bacterium]|nr:RHS repeat-associated core domain-containing protein [Verrucomicrobiota bacterium]
MEKEFQACLENGLKRAAFEVNSELLKILTLLSKTQSDLDAKKSACTEFNEAFLKEADTLRITDTPWSDVKQTKAEEDKRRALFYAKNAFDQIQSPQIQSPSLTQCADNLCVTPIDNPKMGESTDYVLQTNTAYRFALQNVDDISEIYVKIFDNFAKIHEVKIAIPKPHSLSWDYYILQNGFVHTPEDELLKDYGLDLTLRLYYDEEYKTNIVIAQKALSTKYTFEIGFGNDRPAYRSTFVEPLPYQLDLLTKPAPYNASKSLRTNSQTAITTAKSSPPQAEEKFPLLDDLVRQLQADPLALAMYVHNEIANDHFSVYMGENHYKAHPINRHPCMVFLEKRGSPWEQCQLLIYLLKKAGYDAQYVTDQLSFLEKSTFEKLFLVKADMPFIAAQLPGVTFFYDDRCVTLYPWLKDIEVTEGYNLYQFFPKDYASGEKWVSRYLKNDEDILKHIGTGSDDTAGVLFTLFAADELRKRGRALDDVGLSYKPIKKQFANWSDFPRPDLFGVVDKESALFTNARIEIKSHTNPNKLITYEFHLADLCCDSLTLDCKDQITYEKTKKTSKKKKKSPKQTIETDVKTQFLGKEQHLYLDPSEDIIDVSLTIYYAHEPFSQTKQIAKGSRAAVSIFSGTEAPAVTAEFYKKFTHEKEESNRLNALLSYTCFAYFEKCARAQSILAKLHKVNEATAVTFGIATLNPTENENLVVPKVDMTYLALPTTLSQQDDPSAYAQYAALVIADSSSNEHQILKDLFKDTHALSTTKLLQLAHAKQKKMGLDGDGFLAFTSSTFEAAGDSLKEIKQNHSAQYETAKNAFLNPFSYAYMTPGKIANLNGKHSEMASLIIHPFHTFALISSNVITINGGVGTPMSKDYFVSSDFTQNFHAYQKKFHQPPQPVHQIATCQADARANYKPSWNSVADPIDVVTGAFYIDETDIDLPFGLAIRRNYNSQNPQDANIGTGWKLSLNPYLVKQDDKLFAAETDGTVIAYTFNEQTARWEVSLADNPELSNYSTDGFNPFKAYIIDDVLYSPDGTRRIYQNGLLQKSISANGLELIFSYTDKLLTRIESSNGQYCGFCYNHENKIVEIYAQDGRRVHYAYNSNGDLLNVTLPNGAEIHYEYDRFHQIIRETKPYGHVIENIYNDEGKVTEQKSPSGFRQELITTAKFTYSDNETTVVDACGGVTTYKIFQKQIYKIIDPLGAEILNSWFIDKNSYFDPEKEQIVSWDQDGGFQRSLKKSTDKRGLTTEYFYDDNGNAILIRISGDDLTGDGVSSIDKKLHYNSLNLCTKEIIGDNTKVTLYDATFPYLACRLENYSLDTLTSYVEFRYNAKGQIIQEDTSGAITTWKYNQAGFPVVKVQKSLTEDPDVVTTYSYNYQGQCTESKSSDAWRKTTYDIAGNAIEMHLFSLSGSLISSLYNTFDLNNQLIRTQTANPNNVVYRDYNAAGQIKALRQRVAPDNKIAYTLYEYDPRGYLVEETNPLGYVTKRAYDALGNVTAITNNDITVYHTYEKGGLEASVALAGAETYRHYTSNGLVLKEIYPDNTVSATVYDIAGRPVEETKNGIRWDIIYNDKEHSVTRLQKDSNIRELYQYDMRGNVIAFTDAEGHLWKKSYDGLDRLVSESTPSGETTYWSYDGDLVITTLPNHEITKTRYAAGKVVETSSYDKEQKCLYHKTWQYDPVLDVETVTIGDSTTITQMNTLGQPILIQQGDIVTKFEYDSAGNCTRIIDGEDHATKKEYDCHGRLISKTLPDSSTYYYNYDVQSNITSCILPNGGVWRASYDSMNRKCSEELIENGISHGHYQYIYADGTLAQQIDPMNRVHFYLYDELKRVTRVEADGWQKRFEYDARGLMTKATTCAPNRETTHVARVYDESARLINEKTYLNSKLIQESEQIWEFAKRTLRIGEHERTFSYSHNKLVNLASESVELSYQYNEAGQLKQKTSPHAATAIAYTAAGLPEEKRTTHPKDSFFESMSWTSTGKLKGYHSSKQDKAFGYTASGRLKFAGDEQCQFDLGATRTSYENHKTLDNGVDSFGKVTAELLDQKTIRSSYNAMGELTSCNSEKYRWDPWGQLLEVSTSSSKWTAIYDAFGRRLETTHTQIGYIYSATSVTTSFFDPEKEFEEIGIQLQDKTFWKYYGQNSCDAVSDNRGQAAYLIHNSLQQLEAIVTSSDVSYVEHYPTSYGPKKQADVFYDITTYAKTLTWQSRTQDPTGLIWIGKRYYNPQCGHFISPDPIGLPVNTNLYSYANGDPINFCDPDGRFQSPVYTPTPAIVPYDYTVEKQGRPRGIFTKSQRYTVGTKKLKKASIGFINGINNSFDDSVKSAKQICAMASGYQIDAIYNASNTILADLPECFVCHFGVRSTPSTMFLEKWKLQIALKGRDIMFLEICHSGGADQLKNALESLKGNDKWIREKIIAVAIAPSVIIPKRLCHESYNYESKRDFVTHLDVIGKIQYGDELTILDPHEDAPLWDHPFLSPTYDRAKRTHINEFLELYGD